LTKNFTLPENEELQTTILERLFPWIRDDVTTKISHNVKKDEPKTLQANNKKPTQTNASQEKKVETTQEKSKKIADKLPLFKESIANDTLQENSFNVPNNPSILEMWNLIESAGFKRELANKAFATDEAVTELYHTVYKRIHYEREQEMLKRLRTYVEKLKEKEISAMKTR
jgi:hypothetical protein